MHACGGSGRVGSSARAILGGEIMIPESRAAHSSQEARAHTDREQEVAPAGGATSPGTSLAKRPSLEVGYGYGDGDHRKRIRHAAFDPASDHARALT